MEVLTLFIALAEAPPSPSRDAQLPSAAGELVRSLGDPAEGAGSVRLAALRALGACAGELAPRMRRRLELQVREAFVQTAAALKAGPRAIYFDYVLTLTLGLGQGGLLPATGQALAQLEGPDATLQSGLGALLPHDDPALAPTPRALDLSQTLGELLEAVSRGDEEGAEPLRAQALELWGPLELTAPNEARMALRAALERGVRAVGTGDELRNLSVGFGHLLELGDLPQHPVASVLALAAPAPVTAGSAGPPDTATFLDRLLGRLEERSQRLPAMLRRPEVGLALLQRVEERVARMTQVTAWAGRADQWVERYTNRLGDMDRRLGILDALYGGGSDPFARLRLGAFADFRDFEDFGPGLTRLRFVLPIAQEVGVDGPTGPLGLGMGFDLSGLALPPLVAGQLGAGMPGMPGFAGLPGFGGGGGFSGFGPGGTANFGSLGAMPGGPVQSTLRALKSGSLPSGMRPAGIGPNIAAMLGLRGGGLRGAARASSGYRALSRAPGGFGHLALGFGGGSQPSYSPGLPPLPNAGWGAPGLSRLAMGQAPRHGGGGGRFPSFPGFGGGHLGSGFAGAGFPGAGSPGLRGFPAAFGGGVSGPAPSGRGAPFKLGRAGGLPSAAALGRGFSGAGLPRLGGSFGGLGLGGRGAALAFGLPQGLGLGRGGGLAPSVSQLLSGLGSVPRGLFGGGGRQSARSLSAGRSWRGGSLPSLPAGGMPRLPGGSRLLPQVGLDGFGRPHLGSPGTGRQLSTFSPGFLPGGWSFPSAALRGFPSMGGSPLASGPRPSGLGSFPGLGRALPRVGGRPSGAPWGPASRAGFPTSSFPSGPGALFPAGSGFQPPRLAGGPLPEFGGARPVQGARSGLGGGSFSFPSFGGASFGGSSSGGSSFGNPPRFDFAGGAGFGGVPSFGSFGPSAQAPRAPGGLPRFPGFSGGLPGFGGGGLPSFGSGGLGGSFPSLSGSGNWPSSPGLQRGSRGVSRGLPAQFHSPSFGAFGLPGGSNFPGGQSPSFGGGGLPNFGGGLPSFSGFGGGGLPSFGGFGGGGLSNFGGFGGGGLSNFGGGGLPGFGSLGPFPGFGAAGSALPSSPRPRGAQLGSFRGSLPGSLELPAPDLGGSRPLFPGGGLRFASAAGSPASTILGGSWGPLLPSLSGGPLGRAEAGQAAGQSTHNRFGRLPRGPGSLLPAGWQLPPRVGGAQGGPRAGASPSPGGGFGPQATLGQGARLPSLGHGLPLGFAQAGRGQAGPSQGLPSFAGLDFGGLGSLDLGGAFPSGLGARGQGFEAGGSFASPGFGAGTLPRFDFSGPSVAGGLSQAGTPQSFTRWAQPIGATPRGSYAPRGGLTLPAPGGLGPGAPSLQSLGVGSTPGAPQFGGAPLSAPNRRWDFDAASRNWTRGTGQHRRVESAGRGLPSVFSPRSRGLTPAGESAPSSSFGSGFDLSRFGAQGPGRTPFAPAGSTPKIGARPGLAPHRALALGSGLMAGATGLQSPLGAGQAPRLSFELPGRPQQTSSWQPFAARGGGDVAPFMSERGLMWPSQVMANPARLVGGLAPAGSGSAYRSQPGADLSRHLLGRPATHSGRGALSLGSRDDLAHAVASSASTRRPPIGSRPRAGAGAFAGTGPLHASLGASPARRGSFGAGPLGTGSLGAGSLGTGSLGTGSLGAGSLGIGSLGTGSLGVGSPGASALGAADGGLLRGFAQSGRDAYGDAPRGGLVAPRAQGSVMPSGGWQGLARQQLDASGGASAPLGAQAFSRGAGRGRPLSTPVGQAGSGVSRFAPGHRELGSGTPSRPRAGALGARSEGPRWSSRRPGSELIRRDSAQASGGSGFGPTGSIPAHGHGFSAGGFSAGGFGAGVRGLAPRGMSAARGLGAGLAAGGLAASGLAAGGGSLAPAGFGGTFGGAPAVGRAGFESSRIAERVSTRSAPMTPGRPSQGGNQILPQTGAAPIAGSLLSGSAGGSWPASAGSFALPAGGGSPQAGAPRPSGVRPSAPAPARAAWPQLPSQAWGGALGAPDMEHTRLVSGPGPAPAAPAGPGGPAPSAGGGRRRAGRAPTSAGRGGEVLYKRAADVDPGGTDGGGLATTQSNELESSHLATPPQDLSVLVNQLYSQIKRELMIERERRGGLY